HSCPPGHSAHRISYSTFVASATSLPRFPAHTPLSPEPRARPASQGEAARRAGDLFRLRPFRAAPPLHTFIHLKYTQMNEMV
ncbi:MAG: hypothetical protein KC419_02490, partial [Anaerolineales bacterium]|nr:hypothetical protein [Anaerolineales bacterium]